MTEFEKVCEEIVSRAKGPKATSEDQKVAATLEALTGIIEAQRGSKIPTAYFAILFSSILESKLDRDAKAASVRLLATIIPCVPVAVVKAKQSDISALIIKIYSDQANAHNSHLLKSLVALAAHIVKIQADPVVIARAEILQLFQLILTLTVDSKPKVRPAAHKSIQQVLRSLKGQAKVPLSNTTTAFLNKLLQKGASKDPKEVLHTLFFLKDIIYLLSETHLNSICESLFALLVGAKNPQITSLVMQCLESLFIPPTSSTDEEQTSELSATLLSPIIASLFTIQPNLSDSLPATSYIQLLTKAFLCLNRIDAQECIRELPRYFKSLMTSFTSEKKDIQNAAYQCFKEILMECITKTVVQQTVSVVTSGADRQSSTPLEKIISILSDGMKYIYKESWSTIFELYGLLFQAIGTGSNPLLAELLKSLVDLHDSEFHTTQFSRSLNVAIGAAISAMGPEKFLQVVPMNLSEGIDSKDSRVWLLPMLKQYIRNTSLSFFGKHFLTLANNIKERAIKLDTDGAQVAAKNLMILYQQIWDLFPSFCNFPTDISQSFKLLAKTLGTSLNDVDLRLKVCEGLIHLIEKNRSVASSNWGEPTFEVPITAKEAQQNLAAISTFSKNFLLVLFNVYAEAPSEEVGVVHKTIEAFVAISDSSNVNTLFKTVVSKFLEATTTKEEGEAMKMDAKNKYIFADLIVPFARGLDLENLHFLYKTIKPLVKGNDVTMQKKAYKILQAMFEGHSQFIRDQSDELTQLFVDTILVCASPAKKLRLRCLRTIIEQLDKQNKKFIPAILGDVIMCTREANGKAREFAESVLTTMANKMSNDIQQFIVMVVAGLAGQTPHMISATLVVLGKLLKDYEASLNITFVHQLLKPIITLLSSNNREIISNDLVLLRGAIAAVPTEEFKQHVPELIKVMMAIPMEERRHHRSAIAFIFERLLKKYDYDFVFSFVPESDQKFLNHIRKMQRRKDKKKQEQDGNTDKSKERKDEDEDFLAGISSDEEQEETEEAQDNGAYIIDSEEPLDLMDVSAVKRVVSSQPKQKKSQKSKPEEKITFEEQDGKIVIPNFGDSEGSDSDANNDMEVDAKKEKGKRKRRNDEEQITEEKPKRGPATAGTTARSKKQKKVDHKSKNSGEQFKSKKGDGDMLHGKTQPYAYVPLNRKLLNRRKQLKATQEFKKIVTAAKKGAKAKPRKPQRR